MNEGRALIVMAKAPVEGRVKTRLGASLGHAEAVRVYRQMTEGVWASVRKGQEQGAYRLWLCFDPPEAGGEMKTWLGGADAYLPQIPGNLGQRLAGAFGAAHCQGFEKVAVIGTDTPAVTHAVVESAFREGRPGRVVVGPTLDGGFYLMLTGAHIPGLDEVLADMPWSCPETLGALLAGAGDLGLEAWHLDPQSDIDTLDDLRSHQKGPLATAFPL